MTSFLIILVIIIISPRVTASSLYDDTKYCTDISQLECTDISQLEWLLGNWQATQRSNVIT